MAKATHDDPKGYKVTDLKTGQTVKFDKAKDAHLRDKQVNGNKSGMSNGTPNPDSGKGWFGRKK